MLMSTKGFLFEFKQMEKTIKAPHRYTPYNWSVDEMECVINFIADRKGYESTKRHFIVLEMEHFCSFVGAASEFESK